MFKKDLKEKGVMKKLSYLLFCVVISAFLASCGGSTPNPGPGPGPEPTGELEDSLKALGVNTEPGKRVDPNQEELPDDFSPLGSSASFGNADTASSDSSANPSKELFLLGTELKDGSRINLLEKTGVQISQNTGAIDEGQTSVIKAFNNDDHPWILGERASETIRDATAADLDGDGFEELVAVYLDLDDNIIYTRVIKRQSDESVSDAAAQESLINGTGVKDIAVVSGDFKGDGKDELALVLSYTDKSELYFVESTSGSFKASEPKPLSTVLTDSSISAELAVGNLDYDRAEELSVVLNETNALGKAARYFVFDDAKKNYLSLKTGDVQGRDGALYTAKVSDVAMGDIDGDGLAEIVMGGFNTLSGGCNSQDVILTALDDAEHNFESLGGHFKKGVFFSKCPSFAQWHISFMHINTVDLDGDGVKEIQANQFIFEDFKEGGAWNLIHQIDDREFFDSEGSQSARFDTTRTAMVAADVTNDGRENILLYSQWKEDVRIFGLSLVESVGFARFTTIETNSYNFQRNVKPILVPINIDVDGPVLTYSEAEYELVFTEPLIIAALAAPPCSKTIGQNWEACVTSFGQGTSTGVDAEVTVSVKASAYVGVKTAANIPFVGKIGADFKKTVTATASASAGGSYTLEKTVTYTTGALEDSVIFTTIPYDQYTYTILSHPDAEMVGKKLVVSMPREPITLIAKRDFYNETVTDDNIKIDERVFSHTSGSIDSYPSKSKKDQILRAGGFLADLYQDGPQSVGQGSGQTTLDISVSDEIRVGGSLGIEYETSVDVTSGPALGGFSVGGGVEASFGVTSGSKTSYTGSVGSIDATNFAANQYSFGLFTYTQKLSDQKFQVINYWVE